MILKRKARGIAALCAAVMCVFSFTAPASAAETVVASNAVSTTADGYDYEFWMDKGQGEGSMTLGEAGSFTCEWNRANNILLRIGKKFDETKTYDELGEIVLEYGCNYEPAGNSYLCVYGWTTDPLIEFYVVESWGNWRPPGATAKGSVSIDGGTYEIYETTRANMPSIRGTQTFQQYWSVRTEKKTEGTVSISEHMKVWEDAGMKLGNMYEVAFCVEGYMSSGKADVYKNSLTVDGKLPPDVEPIRTLSDATEAPKTGNMPDTVVYMVSGAVLIASAGVAIASRKSRKRGN
jgi:endo-1,4-beta-xylanase